MGEEAVREIRCRCTELRCKDVISAADGTRLGYVTDVEIDTCSASVQAIVISEHSPFFGLFGKSAEYIIPWKDIAVIGTDVILVRFCRPPGAGGAKSFFESLFQ